MVKEGAQMCPVQQDFISIDAGVSAQSVRVSYPPMADANSPYRAIVARGNVPLLIEDCLLAEVPRAQLEHEWQVSSTISDADAATYCHRAADRLSRAFDSGIAAADLPDLVANAAVLFVLSLRKAGVRSTGDISPCTVQYDGSSRTGEVCAAA
jgi:hypothetical protein